MSKEACQRCGDEDDDRRTLWMACFYEMDELGLPFEKQVLFHADTKDLTLAKEPATIDLEPGKKITLESGTVTCSGELTPWQLYTLRVCKDCRGEWMGAIKAWFQSYSAKDSPGSGIFIRRNGANVEISEEEWRRLNPDREPVRVRKEPRP